MPRYTKTFVSSRDRSIARASIYVRPRCPSARRRTAKRTDAAERAVPHDQLVTSAPAGGLISEPPTVRQHSETAFGRSFCSLSRVARTCGRASSLRGRGQPTDYSFRPCIGVWKARPGLITKLPLWTIRRGMAMREDRDRLFEAGFQPDQDSSFIRSSDVFADASAAVSVCDVSEFEKSSWPPCSQYADTW